MKVFITGGCGFIGSNLVEHHLNKGDEVQVVDDLSTGTLENIDAFQNNPRFKFHEANLDNWDQLDKVVSWADRVYHMSAVIGIFKVLAEPIRTITSNIAGCERICHAAAKLKSPPRIVIASSSSVYGQTHTEAVSETSPLLLAAVHHPLYGYAVSKIADEALATAYYTKLNLPITSIRIFNTIGPRQTPSYGMVVPRFVRQACLGEPLTVFGDGKQSRSFCDVRDVVVAFDLVGSTTASIGQIVNVGNDREITINELAALVKKHAKSDSDIKHISYQEAYGRDMTDVIKRRPIIKKLVDLTGFKHKWTLEQTVDDLITRFKNQN